MRNRRLVIGIILLCIVVIAVVIMRNHQQPGSAQSNAAPSVSLSTVRYGTFDAKISATGHVGAPAGTQAKVAFPLSGIISSIDVRVGERVYAGQPLARLDTSGLSISAAQAQAEANSAAASYGGGAIPSAALRSAQAKVAVAQSRLSALQRGGAAAQSDRIAARSAVRQAQIKVDADRRLVERAQTLLSAGVTARKDVDTARTQLASDVADLQAQNAKLQAAATSVSAAVTQAQADYAQAVSDLRTAQSQQTVLSQQAVGAGQRAAAARRDLNNGTLYAPVDGVINAVYKHRGEAVDTTTPVVAIGPPAQALITLDVPANDARRVHVGDAASIRVGNTQQRMTGRVTAVVPAVDPTTQSATVVVSGAPSGALAGDAVEASIVVAHDRGKLIPQSAIVQDPQTGKTVVFVRSRKPQGEVFAQREIAVVQSDGTVAEVAGRLDPGEQIAAQGAFQLLAPAAAGD
ncbi:MAG: efflux RND transporter periplasmic adaptor subunit [Candidatus Eremiobacteraeota bacterium]|nr:efflux RND transporter periplasmic adaptor subunit [Candidatus Eremiobacteraeota bacterium]